MKPTAFITRYRTPEGFDDLMLASDGDVLTGVWFEGSRGERKSAADFEEKGLPIFREAGAWLDAYFAGDLSARKVPRYRLEKVTAFRQAVSDEMVKIPFGEVVTYGEIGKRIAAEKGWARLAGDWKEGREVKVNLPMVPRVVKGTKSQENRVAVMCGPRVFGVSPEKLTDKRNYAADIIFLEAGKAMEYTGKGVKVTFGVNSRNLDEMQTELVPFMDEKRTRTFFPFVEKKGIAWVDALKGNEAISVWTKEIQ